MSPALMKSLEIRHPVAIEECSSKELIVPVTDAHSPPDGGYGWVNVIASFFVHVFVLGNIYSFGVFFPVYVDTFGASQAAVSWIGSVSLGLMTGLGAYSGKWADLYGNNRVVFLGGLLIGIGYFLASYSTKIWHLYLTQGFVVGVGYSLSFVAGISVVSQWFVKRRGLALGLAVAGSGFGQVIMSLITATLITHIGWESTLRYLALINVVGLSICAFFIKRLVPCVAQSPTNPGADASPGSNPGAVAVHTDNGSAQSSLRYFSDRKFNLLYFGLLTAVLGMMMPFVYLPQYAMAHGISYNRAVFLLSVMGISSVIGRVSIGMAADNYGRLLMLRYCMCFGGISTLFWQICDQYYSMAIYAAIYPAFAGGLISLIPAVSADEFGVAELGAVMGLLYTSTALGNVLSAPIGGFLYEVQGSYGLPITVSGLCMIAGGGLVACIHHGPEGVQVSPTINSTCNSNSIRTPLPAGTGSWDEDCTKMEDGVGKGAVPVPVPVPSAMSTTFEIE